jgi:hypothetical protein
VKRLSAFRRLASSLAGLAALAGFGLCAPRADAGTAVLAADGTLYEVFTDSYGDVISGANAADSSLPILALRTTPPGGQPVVEVVGGTVSAFDKLGEALEFDDTTQTVFVVYTRVQGFFADVHVAMKRKGGWSDGTFLPNPGLFVSMFPQLLVTRQTYTDVDGSAKSRSILSIVWWEESNASQARYAPVFIEDGALGLDDVTAWNLNDLIGAAGPTDNSGLPMSAYIHPALQADLGTNGGVLVSFANLAVQQQQVIHLGFPDNLPTIVPPDTLSPTQRTSYARGHTPIGRSFTALSIPIVDQPFLVPIGTLISPAGTPTLYWSSGTNLFYQAAGTSTALTLPLRPDFPVDRAIAVIRDMSNKN